MNRYLSKFTWPWLFASLLLAGCAGVTAPAPADRTAANKALALAAHQRVLSGGQLEAAAEYFHEGYIQHNPRIPTGRAGLVGYLKAFRVQFPEQKVQVWRVMAEGDLVTVYSNWEISNPQTQVKRNLAIADLFRVEDGKLIEHWDVIQIAPTP